MSFPDFERYPLAPLFGKQSGWSKDRPVTIEGSSRRWTRRGSTRRRSSRRRPRTATTCRTCATPRRRVSGAVHRRRLGRLPVARCAEKIRYWMGRGLSGLRLFTGGSTAAFDPSWIDDKRSFPAWELAGELGVSVCLQTDASGLAQVAGLAKRFPSGEDPDRSFRPPRPQRRRALQEGDRRISAWRRSRTSISS